MVEVQQVLFFSEAEKFVEDLRCFKLSEIGSDQWERQREQVEKLNIQVGNYNATYSKVKAKDDFTI